MALADFQKKQKKEENIEVKKLKKALAKIGEIKEEKAKEEVGDFSPTLKNPLLKLTTSKGEDYSIWHEPKIYLPFEEKAVEAKPQFIVIKGNTEELYNQNNTEKMIKAHKKLTNSMKKEAASKLIKKIKKPHLLLYLKKNLTQKELNKIIVTSSYLKPEYAMILTEEYVKPEIKIMTPNEINLIENTGLNEKRIEEVLKQVF